MHCILYGRIRITDFERLQQVACDFSLILKENKLTDSVEIYNAESEFIISKSISDILLGSTDKYFKKVIRNYNITKIKHSVQKKGWKIASIEREDNKVRIRVRE